MRPCMHACMHATGQQAESWIWDSPAEFVGTVAPYFPAVETEVRNYAVSIQAPRLGSWQEPHPPQPQLLGVSCPGCQPSQGWGPGEGWGVGSRVRGRLVEAGGGGSAPHCLAAGPTSSLSARAASGPASSPLGVPCCPAEQRAPWGRR